MKVVLFLPYLLALAISLQRCWHIETLARTFLNIEYVFFLSSFLSELFSLGIFIVVYSAALSIPKRMISRMLRSLTLTFLIWMATDAYIQQLFWKRLDINDVLTFGGEISAISFVILSSLSEVKNYLPFSLLGLSIISIVSPWTFNSIPNFKIRISTMLLGCILILLSIIKIDLDSTARPLLVNTIEYNLGYGRHQSYSQIYLDRVRQRYGNGNNIEECVSGKNLKRNLILVVIESLSSYQSMRFSGLNNWLPNIDKISEDGLVFENFVANGYRTDMGLISILTGRWPILLWNESKPYQAFHSIQDSFPYRLRRYGYQTAFISGAPLSFLGSKEWLESIGFMEMVGPEEEPSFRTGKGFLMSIEDNELYDLSLKKIRTSSSQFFIVINTVSSHVPFSDPTTGERGEEAALRYSDRAFAHFIEQLRRIKYFENGGILAVLGDHRALTPISKKEQEIFNDGTARARIPLIILGEGIKGIRSGTEASKKLYQQTDISPSFEYLLGQRSCFRVGQNNLFAENLLKTHCSSHVRGDVPNLVSLFCGTETGLIELRGDETRITGIQLSAEEPILDEIAISSLQFQRKFAEHLNIR